MLFGFLSTRGFWRAQSARILARTERTFILHGVRMLTEIPHVYR